MSATMALLIIAVVWVAIGVAASLVMGRRGHTPWVWLVLGGILGPLAVAMARANMAREADVRPRAVLAGEPGPGEVDVLVGVDGSPQARGGLQSVVELLGSRLGRLTIATVVAYDTALTDLPTQEHDHALGELERCADGVRSLGATPATVVLAGAPDQALVDYARDEGYDLLVIGNRGRGLSRLAFGSVAQRLAGGSSIPVMIISTPPASDGASTKSGHDA